MDYQLQIFQDRSEAGRRLATHFAQFAGRHDVLVLALPRGGVPVAAEIARAIRAPLDVLVVRKLGVPGQPELAMGAIASGGIRVDNHDVIDHLGIPETDVERVAAIEQQELERRERLFRADRARLDIEGRIVILVDDGIATGSTMLAAIEALRSRNPSRLIVAAPVAAASTCRRIGREVDDLVCLSTPEPFYAVGYFYRYFPQISDEEVREILERNASAPVKSSTEPPGADSG